jgi:hypothetical protein
MVPILFHGLSQLGFPVICVETQQAHQALKLLAAHKTDRNAMTREGRLLANCDFNLAALNLAYPSSAR